VSIPIVKILGGVLKTAAGIAGIHLGSAEGGVLEKAGEILERIKDTPEMRLETMKHEEELLRIANEEMKIANEESLAMLGSSDKFVARARPTGLYLFYIASLALVIAHIAGKTIDPTFVWSVLAPLAGTGGLYIWKRTSEKMNGNGHGG
jgi:hypothetical protein